MRLRNLASICKTRRWWSVIGFMIRPPPGAVHTGHTHRMPEAVKYMLPRPATLDPRMPLSRGHVSLCMTHAGEHVAPRSHSELEIAQEYDNLHSANLPGCL